MSRTLTVFTISDPDVPAEERKQLLSVALKHEPLTQERVELRLRSVANELGCRTWADLGRRFLGDATVELLEAHGFEVVRDQVFFGVAGIGKLVPDEPTGDSLLEKVAEAAKEPTAEEWITELCAFVHDELELDDDDEATEALDEAVHDFKSGEAADINNGGLDSQIEYLCEGMSLEDARDYLRSETGQDDEDSDDEDDD